MVGIGASLLSLSQRFVLNGNVLFGLSLLNVSVSLLNVMSLQITGGRGFCRAPNVSAKVGVSKLLCYLERS